MHDLSAVLHAAKTDSATLQRPLQVQAEWHPIDSATQCISVLLLQKQTLTPSTLSHQDQNPDQANQVNHMEQQLAGWAGSLEP